MEEVCSVNPPDPPPITVDPNLAAEQQQAQNDMTRSLQSQSQGDMASLMARYGTQLAMSGAGGSSPLATPAANRGP